MEPVAFLEELVAELLGAGGERATVVFAGVADEEDRMLGEHLLPRLKARESPWLLLEAVETPADHPVVRLAEESVEAVLGRPLTAGGAPYGTVVYAEMARRLVRHRAERRSAR